MLTRIFSRNRPEQRRHPIPPPTAAHRTQTPLSDELGITFLETSAKDAINVEQAFLTMAGEIKKKPCLWRGGSLAMLAESCIHLKDGLTGFFLFICFCWN